MRGVGDKAVYGELHSLRTEIARENCRNRAGDAAVCGGVLRVGGSRCQRRPCWVAHELGIATSRTYGGDKAPKTEGELGIPPTHHPLPLSSPQQPHNTPPIP